MFAHEYFFPPPPPLFGFNPSTHTGGVPLRAGGEARRCMTLTGLTGNAFCRKRVIVSMRVVPRRGVEWGEPVGVSEGDIPVAVPAPNRHGNTLITHGGRILKLYEHKK